MAVDRLTQRAGETVAEKLSEVYFGQPATRAATAARRRPRIARLAVLVCGAVGCVGLLAWWLHLAAPQARRPGTIVLADFDTGSLPHRLGGYVGIWLSHPEDATQRCQVAFDRQQARGGAGYALRVEYDVESARPARTGVWMTVPSAPALGAADALEFSAKADGSLGATRTFRVVLRSPHHRFAHTVRGLTPGWRTFKIPLGRLQGEPLHELVFLFEDQAVTQRVGTLYLDDLQFRRGVFQTTGRGG